MKWIVQFVLKQFAKRSDKKTGVAKLLNETDPIVQSNVRNIEIQLKNLGINPEDLTSTDDVLKALNYHNALMNQNLKQSKNYQLRKRWNLTLMKSQYLLPKLNPSAKLKQILN